MQFVCCRNACILLAIKASLVLHRSQTNEEPEQWYISVFCFFYDVQSLQNTTVTSNEVMQH